jgi:riboflavin synthase
MFTGIVTDIGTVRAVRHTSRDWRFEIATSYDLSTVDIGASISHSGCCLTVVEKMEGAFAVEVSGETLSLTHLGDWKVGRRINLERAAKVGDELGGHIVSGHVDGLGQVLSFEQRGESWELLVLAPPALARFIAYKGSITVNGVSLTVNLVRDVPEGCELSINLIPHTYQNTALHALTAGAKVNLEIDLIARYVERMLGQTALPAASASAT